MDGTATITSNKGWKWDFAAIAFEAVHTRSAIAGRRTRRCRTSTGWRTPVGDAQRSPLAGEARIHRYGYREARRRERAARAEGDLGPLALALASLVTKRAEDLKLDSVLV